MKRRLFRARTGLLFAPAVLLVGWALYPPGYDVFAGGSPSQSEPIPPTAEPWFIHGNENLAFTGAPADPEKFLGSALGFDHDVVIKTFGFERMRVLKSHAIDPALNGQVQIRTNLSLEAPFAGTTGDITMLHGRWRGINPASGSDSEGDLVQVLGSHTVEAGNVNVDMGNVDIGMYDLNYVPGLGANLLVQNGQFLMGTNEEPVDAHASGKMVVRIDGFGRGPKIGDESNHVLFIKSHDDPNMGDTPDGIAIQLERNTSTADAPFGETIASNNFITFYNGNAVAVGKIEGFFNAAGNPQRGITVESGGADFAECLEKIDPAANFEAGEIVGVYGGRISKQTDGADHVMVITGGPVVLGNAPPAHLRHLYADVAFMGQVPVLVRGAVAAGDYIVPSGLGDGTGVAIAPGDLTVANMSQIVGKAWSGSQPAQNRRGGVNNGGLTYVNVAVGLKSTEQQALIDVFNRRMAATLARLNALARRVADLEAGN